MQTTNLPLFSDEDLKPSIRLQEQTINQEKTLTVAETDNSLYTEQEKKPEQLFNNLFLERPEQSKAGKARQILGENTINITDEELEAFTTKLDYLTNSWLDLFEKQLFDGKTLRELTKLDIL